MDVEIANKLSRLIDIYPFVFTSYTEDLLRPDSKELACGDDLFLLLSALLPFRENVRILNSLIKLLSLVALKRNTKDQELEIIRMKFCIDSALERLLD